jgi:outer membrane protein OmpA-like peptidoglycan-associated protein
VKWYAKATQTKQEAETYYQYAQMLKAEGQYDAANTQMDVFASMAPKDKRAISFKENPNYLSQLQSQAKMFSISPSSVSSDTSDFGAVLTNDNTIYFSSARNKARKTNPWNEEPYLDLYQATYNADGTVSNAALVSGGVNTKWNEGPATLSQDGNTMYYSSESYNEGEFEKDKSVNAKFSRIYLYKATKQEGVWTKGTALSLNNKSYSMRNPSLSKDEKTLYFSSDMPGGLGKEDIWKVSINADGYGTPENLGSNVNTAGDDSFPFIADNGVLYFTSASRLGFGGFDVYMMDTNNPEEATNLGEPVNSEKDDFSFTYNQTKKVALFSSNREGVDNIYLASPICGVNGLVIVSDIATAKQLQDAIITLVDDKGMIVASNSENPSMTSFGLACEKQYSVQVSKSGYEEGIFTIVPQEGGVYVLEAKLTAIKPIITEKEVILEAIYFEFDKSNITQQGAAELDRLVAVMNEYQEMVIFAKSHTDSRGKDKYNLNLSERRAKATVQYVISKGIDKERITGQGFGESELKVVCDNCTEEEHAQNRRSEFLIVKK